MIIMLRLQCCMIACLLLFMAVQSARNENNCEEREKSLISLDIAEYLITKAKDLLPNCSDVATNTSECGVKEKVSAHLDMAKKLISETKNNFPTCIDPETEEPEEPKEYPKSRDCSEVLQNGQNMSGVYTIWPSSSLFPNKSLEVFCDMETDGGGWTVIQRRGDFKPQEDFYRDWNDYKVGFGNLERDFWLGNDNLYILSNQRKYAIRFDIQSVEKENAYALYDAFHIDGEGSRYKFHCGKYSGNAGDSMYLHNQNDFYTKDRDTSRKCASQRRGGWWYADCAYANLNGEYKPGKDDKSSMTWYHWKDIWIGVAASEIKIKAIAD